MLIQSKWLHYFLCVNLIPTLPLPPSLPPSPPLPPFFPPSPSLLLSLHLSFTSMMYTALDLQDMTDSLPENFKASLSGALLKRFEYEFHSASFHLMLEVVTALRTVVGHTIKSLQETRQEDTVSLEMQKVPEFMLNLYEHLTKEREVLYEIGIQSASPSHISCLAELPLSSVYCCLKLFFGWIEEGYYDFSALPFAFKVHMSYQDKSVVDQQLRLKWQGSVPDLLEELQNLIDVLKHSEQDITSRVNEAANVRALIILISSEVVPRHHAECLDSHFEYYWSSLGKRPITFEYQFSV